ncbi:restriction endonuclease subunit S, partial [uncultured Parolsenella sp.]|uniref:restriction endonuclease subunit S n=1 Tax=uncultured Parolsenella sp. TaxID=2083008 RepID=UPI0025F02E66
MRRGTWRQRRDRGSGGRGAAARARRGARARRKRGRRYRPGDGGRPNKKDYDIASDGSRYEKRVDAKGRESGPVCIDDEIPFEIPGGWEWARLYSIADVQLGKMLDKQKNAGELKPYLRNANVQWGYFDLNEVHSMALSKDEQARFLLQQGDLMVCEGGEPGRCAIWGSRSCEMYYQKALHRVRCASDSLEVEYCAIVVEYFVRARLLESKMTGTTIKHLPARNLERMLVPLPSLVEQRRIAARVAELMPLVEQY